MGKIQRVTVDILMVDGTTHENVEIIGADRKRWSETAQRHKWPKQQDDPDLWLMFLCWSALYRTGKYPQGFDSFANDVSAYDMADDEEVDPTAPTTTGV